MGVSPGSQTAFVKIGSAFTGWNLGWDVNERFSDTEGLLIVAIADATELATMADGQLLILEFDLVAG
ncbi:hypothetical protein N9N28_13615 [Rubripirellula amarantea]|nr:hypothetical protein [Rubripirellula amarantea]